MKEHVIRKQIALAAPLARVWQALTDHRQFGQWFRVKLERPFAEGQTVGGNITWPGYEHLRMEVVVTAVHPMSYFAYTWHPYAIDQKNDYSQETPTLVEFRLEEADGKILLTVTESGFDNIPEERYADAFRMNSRGWEQQLENIRVYLDTAAA